MRGLLLPVALSCLATSGLVQHPDVDQLAELVRAYRSGRGDDAIAVLRGWESGRARKASIAFESASDPWSRSALALLHAETAFVGNTDHPDREHHQRSEALVAQVLVEARSAANAELLSFCRDWYLLNIQADRWPWLEEQFHADPLFLLRYGTWLEYWMWRIPAGPSGYAWGIGEPALTTSHGQFGLEAERAVSVLRRSLSLSPDLLEARVRLGRVLWLMDRDSEAEVELESVVTQVVPPSERQWPYLAGYFLGQLYEGNGDPVRARVTFERARTAYPQGQAVVLALGRLLVDRGDAPSGWALIADVVSLPAPSPDPWTVYMSEVRPGPEQRARYVRLRARVQLGRVS